MFAGLGAARIRELFEEARKNAPAIVFIDELDAAGSARRAAAGYNREHDQTLNQLLVELDGFGARDDVIVMARVQPPAGSRPRAARPGRFDRQVLVFTPDLKGREAILAGPYAVEAARLGRRPRRDRAADGGLTGADLANICNEAAIFAARQGSGRSARAEFEGAMERVVAACRQRRVVTDKEKRILAYHEAGHALMSHLMGDVLPVQKVTIVSRGDSARLHVQPAGRGSLPAHAGGAPRPDEGAAGRPRGGAGRLRPDHERRRQRPRARDRHRARRWCSSTACPRSLRRARCEPTTTRSPRRRNGCATASRHGSPMTPTTRRSGCCASTAPSLDRVAAALLEKETLDRAELDELLADLHARVALERDGRNGRGSCSRRGE